MKKVLLYFFIITNIFAFSQNCEVGQNISICKGEVVQITTNFSNGIQYVWSTGDTSQNIQVSPILTTSYYLTVTLNGQSYIDSSMVFVVNSSISEDMFICGLDTLELIASDGVFYYWFTTDSLYHSYNQSITVITDTTITLYCDITSYGMNHIYNGDFELGNQGFSSQYSYSPITLGPETTYMVGINAQTYHPGFAPCMDHTTGFGNHMIINGAVYPNQTVWQQTVQITPNTDYIFSCWVQNVTPAGNLPQLQFNINGILSGPIFTSSNILCLWTNYYTLWNSGSNSTAVISLLNQNTGGSGNDFALDDIFFSELLTCTDSVTIFLDEQPEINLGNDTSICEGQQLILHSLGQFNDYLWSTGDTTSSITVIASGTYWCIGKISQNCFSMDSINILFKPQPFLEITADNNPICEGETTQLTVESSIEPIQLIWNNGMSNETIRVTPQQNTIYSVIGNLNGCSDTVEFEINVLPKPEINLGEDDYICKGTQIILNLDTLDGQFLWSNEEISNYIVIEDPGTYWVFYDSIGCISSDTITFSECSEINVPNIFTPNGDQCNDNFYPETSGIDTLTIWIYDRWGKLVFKTNDFKTGWNGVIHETDAPEGQYYWAMFYVENRSGRIRKNKEINGTVILVR